MKNTINKQLMIFYKSTTIFKFLLFRNNYMILSIILLGIITFLFNKNLNYFNALSIENLAASNGFNIKRIIFFLISFYLCYIKFNILFRLFISIKGILYFYKEIKVNKIEDIKTICLYFYIINLFFISISILFVMNLTNNIFTINNDLGIYTDLSTSLISLIILLFYFKKLLNNKFVINPNQINPLKIIFIIFTPFILLNFYSDKIINLFNDYNIFKFSTIHCDPKEDTYSTVKNEIEEGAFSKFIKWVFTMDETKAYIICGILILSLFYGGYCVIKHPELLGDSSHTNQPEPDIPLNEITRQNRE